MKGFIRHALLKLGMWGLITVVTVLIILLASVVEYLSYLNMGVTTRAEGWLMLIAMPLIFAPPLLYIMLNQFRELDVEHERLFMVQQELQSALDEVKELRGMLAMCAGCKKVRDADESWIHIDVYLRDNTRAEISHGLCPDCLIAHT